jgi:hypothetical protein
LVKIVSAIAVTVRLSVLLALSWLLVGLASPTPDPLVVDLAWLAMVALVLSIPVSRHALSFWVSTGRLRRTSA